MVGMVALCFVGGRACLRGGRRSMVRVYIWWLGWWIVDATNAVVLSGVAANGLGGGVAG